MVELDDLQLYMGESLKINDKLVFHQAKLRDILQIGEQQYGTMVHLLTTIPSDYKAMLFDMGFDWMEISNFDFFCFMLHMFSQSCMQTGLMWGDVDFSKFELRPDKDGNAVLCNVENGVFIDETIYKIISNFVCKCNSIVPKVEKAGNKATKDFLVREDRERKAREAAKPQNKESNLRTLISSLVNSAEFKYDLSGVMDLTLLQLRDSAMRISAIRMSEIAYNGLYAQGIDAEKLDKSILDWMRPLQK